MYTAVGLRVYKIINFENRIDHHPPPHFIYAATRAPRSVCVGLYYYTIRKPPPPVIMSYFDQSPRELL